ncbi:M48 family metallopeptidase [Tropicibacter sp. S64]|uniref:M48 family metallopeptidase n=1 Tax=Tropicibacter sp. S64 TaxID=3415122 RepID=UPI003C7AA6CE
MLKARLDKLHHKLGETVFLDALQSHVTGQRKTRVDGAVTLLSLLILLIPVLLAVAGIYLAWIGFPHVLVLIVAGLLIALAVYLGPRLHRIPKDALGPDELPQTFALIDAVGDRLIAPPIRYVVFDGLLNAGVSTIRNQHVLHIGLPLWLSLPREGRIAVLAHEQAHLVNDDPRRSGLLGRALEQLDHWDALLAPDIARDWYTDEEIRVGRGIMSDIITGAVQGVIDLLRFTLLRLSYVRAQHAEYLADALAMRVAGRDAMLAELDTLIGIEAVATIWRRAEPLPGESGRDFLYRIAADCRALDPDTRAAARARGLEQKLALTDTHPPSHYRIAFLKSLEAPAVQPFTWDKWRRVEAEIDRHVAKIGDRLLLSLERQ